MYVYLYFMAYMKNVLSCIVIDDSKLDTAVIAAEISNCKDLNLLGTYENSLDAVNIFNTQKPDIAFIDIDMPDINGLELIKGINNQTGLNIITSAHPEYAIEGFKLKVFDFLLKPVETDVFLSCIDRAKQFNELKNKAHAYDILFEDEDIIFKEDYQTIKLKANDILYLEAYGDYTKIVTEKKSHLTLTTLSNFLTSLPEGKFLRSHRSYVVSVNKIKSLGTRSIDLGFEIIPIGKTYFKEIRNILKKSS